MNAAPPAPSPWLLRFVHLIRPGGTVLDLACGSGRHLRWLAQHGWRVTGVDRDAAALAPLAALAETVVADLESAPWPLPGRRFDAVLVTNYLWRPLWPALADSLADGGVLIYETFAAGQQTLGRPARAEFLLQPGELLQAFAALRVVAFEDGFEPPPADAASEGGARFVQRLVALRPSPAAEGAAPARYALAGPSR